MHELAHIGHTFGSETAPKLVENRGVLFAGIASHPRLLLSVNESRKSAESDVLATHDQVLNSLSPSKQGWDRCEDTCSNIAEPDALGQLALGLTAGPAKQMWGLPILDHSRQLRLRSKWVTRTP